MSQDKNVKKIANFSWWKTILGGALVAACIPFLVIYISAPRENMAMGIGFIFFMIAGGSLLYISLFKGGEGGYNFNKRVTGQENAIVLMAKKNSNGKDVPLGIKFCEIKKIPPGSRPRFLRNLKRHYHYLKFDTDKNNRLVPVELPDKLSYTPELFQFPATMQNYKEAIDYTPPTLAQKIAPGAILVAMLIVGFLMIITMDDSSQSDRKTSMIESTPIVQMVDER